MSKTLTGEKIINILQEHDSRSMSERMKTSFIS
jgi:hypothetical protein